MRLLQGKNKILGRKNADSGFTLTELLVSIAIVGILASLAIPRLAPQTEKARSAEAISILGAIRQGQENYLLENAAYQPLAIGDTDAVWNLIGMDNPNPPASRYFTYAVTTTVGPNTFTATATRNGVNDTGNNQNTTITLNETAVFGGTHPNVPV